MFISLTLLPAIGNNIVCSYISRSSGYKPVILYLLCINLYQYLLPIIPNPNEYLLSVINLLVPFSYGFSIYRFYSRVKDEDILRDYNKKKINSLIPALIISIIAVYFTSGYFKYYMVAIASGSMTPNINKGDVVIIEKTNKYDEIEVGQVMAYKYNNVIVVHRVIRKINDYQDRLKLVKFLVNKLKNDDIVLWYCGVFVSFVNTIIDIVHIKNAKFVRDVCELPYGTSEETIKSVKLRKKTLLKQFPKCDGFITISDALTNLVKKYQSSYAKVIKIPILVDFEKYDLPDYSKNSEFPYILHSGTLYEQKDGILGMIEAFGIASQKLSYSIRFILTGKKESSPHFLEINNLIKKYQLEDKIIFTGYLSDSELKEYLSKASLVIINKYKTQQNEYCFSTKLGEYLSAGKPVIITKVGEAMNWLTDGESAYFVESEDVLLLAEKIVHAFTDTEDRCKIAHRGKIVCKNSFDYHGYGSKLLDFFYSISH